MGSIPYFPRNETVFLDWSPHGRGLKGEVGGKSEGRKGGLPRRSGITRGPQVEPKGLDQVGITFNPGGQSLLVNIARQGEPGPSGRVAVE